MKRTIKNPAKPGTILKKVVKEAIKKVSKRTTTVSEISMDEWYTMWYHCHTCNCTSIAEFFNYCPECGRKIEWNS